MHLSREQPPAHSSFSHKHNEVKMRGKVPLPLFQMIFRNKSIVILPCIWNIWMRTNELYAQRLDKILNRKKIFNDSLCGLGKGVHSKQCLANIVRKEQRSFFCLRRIGKKRNDKSNESRQRLENCIPAARNQKLDHDMIHTILLGQST